MARRTEQVAGRFRRLKLKLGGGDGLDVERVRAVRSRTDLPLQVDVNEWWSLDEALEAIPRLAELGVAYVEQPLPCRRPRCGGAPGRARRSRSTSTRTVTRSPTSRGAARSPTGSTSSSPSREGSARRSGWRMPRARSASASCSAAWSSPGSGSRRVRRRSALRSRRPRRQPPARRGPLSGRDVRGRRAGAVGGAGSRCRLGALSDPGGGLLRRSALRQDDARGPALPARRRRGDPGLDAGGRDRSRGFRSSRTSRRRCRCEPTTALVGVATQGGRFPPAWRELLRDCIRQGIGIENGLHEFVTDDPELVALAEDVRRHADRPAPTSGRPRRADRRESRGPGHIVLTVGSDCAIGKMTVSLELDREARARGIATRFVPTGQTGIAIAGLGDLRRLGRRGLHRRRGGAARRRGRPSAGETFCSSKARARSRIPPIQESRSGSSTARPRTPSCSATWRAQPRSTAIRAIRCSPCRSSSSCTSGSR